MGGECSRTMYQIFKNPNLNNFVVRVEIRDYLMSIVVTSCNEQNLSLSWQV